jgi:type I restriction enzyme S subunit
MSESRTSFTGKWFSYVPADWDLKRIGDLVTQKITYGIVQPGDYDPNGVYLIRGQDYMTGWKDLSTFYKVKVDLHNRYRRSVVKGGDILLSIAGYVGTVAEVPQFISEANITQTTARISCNPNVLDSKYFLQFMQSSHGQLQSKRYGKGSAQEGLNLEDIESFLVPLPNIKEQKKIAEILSSVDKVIDLANLKISKLEFLKKSTVNKLLLVGINNTEFYSTELGDIPKSWKVTSIGENSAKVGSGVTPKGGSKVYGSSGIKLIRSQNVYPEQLKLDDVAYISQEIDESMSASRLSEDDVLLNITGASIGRCAVVPKNFGPANVNQHVCIIRINKNLLPRYLMYWLNSDYGQKEIMRFQAGGNREGLNFQQIRSLLIQTPTLSEQKRICEILDAISKEIFLRKEKRESLISLKKSLMQELLTGKVRVKVN